MDKLKDDYEEDKSVMQYLIDIILLPFRIATSPVLLRTYLRTVLLFLTSISLFGVAVVAYTSFYYSYIPVRGINVPVYLQYDHDMSTTVVPPQIPVTAAARPSKWPFGIANVPGLVDRQKYDVVVSMVVPRSESNLKAGNWMIGLEMRGPTTLGGGVMSLLGWDEEWSVEDHSQGGVAGATTEKGTADTAELGRATVLARSRRPALLTYRSWVVEHAYRFLRLPFYLLGWHTESEFVEINMMEGVMFEAGYRNVPSSLRVEVRSKYPLEVYRVSVQISAKLEGLRWLMFRYWISSAIIGIGLFWSVEMGVLLCTWAAFTILFGRSSSSPADGKKAIKNTDSTKAVKSETDPDTPLSATNRTFPTLPSQQPLSYISPKEEEEDEESKTKLEDIPTREDAEADDEDDDFVLQEPLPRLGEREGVFTDSGIGTSMESGIERGLARRRSGRGRGDDVGG